MAHNSSDFCKNEANLCIMSSPKVTTLNFIRQYARTCVTVDGCSLGSVILN